MFRRYREADKVKAVVMEVEGRRALVLTAGGDFRRVRLDRPGCQVGEEVFVPARPEQALGARPLFYGSFALAAAAAFAFALVVGRPTAPAADSPGARVPAAVETVMAYVSVDINPSAELAVDGQGLVVAARALNGDAVELLSAVPYRLRPLDAVIGDLTEAAVQRGFLARHKENAVVIAAVPARGGPLPPTVFEKVYTGERRAREIMAKNGIEGAVGAARVRRASIRAEAERLDLSVGKYLIMLEAQKDGIDVAPEELRSQAVGRIFQARGVKPGDIIGHRGARADDDWDWLLDEAGAVASGRDHGDEDEHGLADDSGRRGEKEVRGAGRGKGRSTKEGKRRGADGEDEGGLIAPGLGHPGAAWDEGGSGGAEGRDGKRSAGDEGVREDPGWSAEGRDWGGYWDGKRRGDWETTGDGKERKDDGEKRKGDGERGDDREGD